MNTGHRTMDPAEQARFDAKFSVQNKRDEIGRAVNDLQTKMRNGNPQEVEAAGAKMNKLVEELDEMAGRSESNAIFRSGNKYTTKATIVSGTLAGAGIAGAATTGGIIAWNNKKQGDKA
ncbi:hypothetical protein [Rhizosaccharibacter radicis]|uniref:DUF883 domain-containing protein n=1 Tax=Rhizosaccharibacter radicis TaxID=2782605 RepID=A0ABT1VTF7_9PROT|nr:hypothetical protein [Acetobacteraceae bacterium KSS12]